ncbi:MAG: hypothetical protein ACAI43_14565 [Phycisphaerae bacterium]
MVISTVVAVEHQSPPRATSKPATTRAATTRPLTPAGQAVFEFRALLRKGDRDAAQKLVATSPAPVRDAERRVKRLADVLAAPTKWDFRILDGKESGDVAVVLINDYLKDGRKTIDIKPWYLLRQEGKWKLLGKYTDFELDAYGFDAARIAEYRKLEEWAERRTPELRRDEPECGC